MFKIQSQAIPENIIGQIREDSSAGVPMEKSIRKLYDMGLTITQSIKVIRTGFGISLREAKDHVSNHPVWAAVTLAAGPLHEDLDADIRSVLYK